MKRLELHEILCGILGSRHVYYQPPESVKMMYPAIVYELDRVDKNHADNGVYLFHERYSATVISKDPDTPILEKMIRLPNCRFNRAYKSDNLNHYVFEIYA